MIRENFDCVFAIKAPSEELQKIILESCDKIISLEEGSNEDEFVRLVSADCIVVLDGYGFKTDLQTAIKDKGCKLICIDDLHAWHFVADVIVNQDGNNNINYSKEPYTSVFTGLDYAMLRKPFLNAAKKERDLRKIENIIINFGGADSNNLTSKVLEACLKIEHQIKIHIVTGAAYSYLNTLDKYRGQQNILFYSQLNADQMCNLMQNGELIICPASSVCIEALSMGLNIITGYYADNQKEFANFLDERHYAKSVGNFLEIPTSQLEELIDRTIRYESMHSPAKIIDGNQAVRFVNLFKSL